MEIDVEELLNDDDDFFEKELPERIKRDNLPSKNVSDSIETPEEIRDDSKDLPDLCGRLEMWHKRCVDLLVDLRTINYTIVDEDTYIEFHDKNYYSNRLYFKVDPDNPKDEKVIHATKQLCKIIGIPYTFFATCRPTLKMNIFKTWQAGLADDVKKAQNILKIRESDGCTIIRAVTSTAKSFIPLYELIQIIRDSLTIPFKLDCVYGDSKDDLIFHARFLFEKEYDFNGPVQLGFSISASELDACPLAIDVLLYNKISKTYCVASYGGESFFKSDYKGLQPSSFKDILPAMLTRLDDEIPEIFERLKKKQSDYDISTFCSESEAIEICKTKGLTSKMKKAIYYQIAECEDEINSPWDLAKHIGLVAKDFESLKRLKIEKAIGIYLNLFFSEGVEEC